MKLTGNKILITGGATGIGLGLTELFYQQKNQIIICGRREDALKEAALKFPGIVTHRCDLAVEQDRINLHQWISSTHSDLNVVINNAGVQHWMDVTAPDFLARSQNEIAINIEAPVHLCSLFAQTPSVKTIINVTSGLAFMPFAKVPVYSATKAFFRSFTISLRHLLKPRGIEVIELIPPALNTDLGGKGLHDNAPPVSEFIKTVLAGLQEGKEEIAFGMADARLKATPSLWIDMFNQMHPR